MIIEDSIRCYCFNSNCNNSIFKPNSCVVKEVPLALALSAEQYCDVCSQPLVAKLLVQIDADLNAILSPNLYTSLIISPTPDHFKTTAKLFNIAPKFDDMRYLTNIADALHHLQIVKDEPDNLPDFIFLDVDLPGKSAWDFLKQFGIVSPALKKRVVIYLLSDDDTPKFKDHIELYPQVKEMIPKNFGLDFINRMKS